MFIKRQIINFVISKKIRHFYHLPLLMFVYFVLQILNTCNIIMTYDDKLTNIIITIFFLIVMCVLYT